MGRPKKHPHGYDSRIAYCDTITLDLIPELVRNSYLLAESLPIEVTPLLQEAGENFLTSLVNSVQRLNNVEQLREFYSACKRRYAELDNITSLLLTADDDGVQVHRVDGKGGLRVYLLGKRNRRVCITYGEADEVYIQMKHPGCYKYLVKIIPDLVEIMNRFHDMGEIDEDQYHSSLKQIMRVIISLGKAYEDIRGGSKFIDSEYDLAIERMNDHHELDHESEWFILLNEVINDINEGVENLRECPRYVKDISKALQQDVPPFCYEDYHLSLKSSGTLINNKPYPAIYSSIVETNPYGDVPEIGYKSYYNTTYPSDLSVQQFGCKAIIIKQHKLDGRFIKIGDNPRQDIGSYFHNRSMDVLRKLPCDCTLDQDKGRIFARKVGSPAYYRVNNNSIYCLDISKATDTLDQEFQYICMSILFGRDRAHIWSELMKTEQVLVNRNKVLCRYVQKCGQSQGFKSSFPAFAWAHHIVMRMVMAHNGLKELDPRQFYRVLGDDSIISCYDPHCRIRNDYIEICKFINWHVNDKGYEFNPSVDRAAFTEFGKVRYLDGEVCSPIPIRLLSKSVTSKSAFVSYILWYSKVIDTVPCERFIDYMHTMYDISDKEERIYALLSSNKSSAFGVLGSYFTEEEYSQIPEGTKFAVNFAYSIEYLKQTLINEFIPSTLKEDEKEVRKRTAFLESKSENMLLGYIQNDNHKYLQMVQRNEDLINAVNEIFDSSNMGIVSATLRLSEEDKDSIITLCEILMDLNHGILPDYNDTLILMDKCQKILGKYNPRSFIKRTASSEYFVDGIVSRLDKIVDLIKSCK